MARRAPVKRKPNPAVATATPSRRRRDDSIDRRQLTLEEAAAVLERPVSEVQKDIRARFLRARRVRGVEIVTVAECHRFLAEERADRAALHAGAATIRRAKGRTGTPAHEVFRRLGLE
jgi:hypothetical protein